MKKGLRYLAFGFFISSLNILVAIAQPTLDFARGIGGANDDRGVGIGIVDSSANNLVFTTGAFKSTAVNFNPGGTARSLSSSSTLTNDFYLGKYKSTGVLVSANSLGAFRVGSTLNDESTKIYVDAGQNVYVVGTISGTSRVDRFNALYTINGGSGIAFIVKYDKDFTVQWAKGFGDGTASTGGARVNDIAVDNSGNVYVTGIFQSPNPVDFNPATVGAGPKDGGTPTPVTLTSNSSGYDAFVAKYTSGGTCSWAINMGGTSSDEGTGIGVDASGNVYVTGIFRGQNIDFDPSAGGTANLSEVGGGSSTGDIFVAKYSTSGSYINAFNLGNALQEGVAGIAVENSTGDFAITGFLAKDVLPLDFDPGVGTANAFAAGSAGTDLFLVKYSSAFAYQWHKTVGSTGNERGNAIKLAGSNLFVTGSYEGTATDFGDSHPLTSAGALDAFMAGYSFSSGTCFFASTLGGTSNEEGMGIDYLNNKLYVTGYYNGSGDYDPSGGTTTLTNSGGQDIFFGQYTYVSCILPSITTQPASISRCVGGSANFAVVSTGATSFQWKKGGVNVSTGTGGTTNSYTINPVAIGDAGNYTVDVINGCGTVTSSPAAVLTVNTPVVITSQPSSLNRCIGTSATFSVGASGSNGPYTYQWKKGGSDISGAQSVSYIIPSVVAGDAGNYTVAVTNACGTVTSSPAAVLSVATDLTINSHPSSVSVCSGSQASFAVSATSSGSLSYQWKKGGAIISGAQSPSYSINPVAVADAGNYTVDVMSTGCGTITSNIAVLALNDVVITTQPASSTTLCTGNTFNLSVAVSGAAPFNYQWKKGASNANGTSTAQDYSISPVVFEDAGSYTVTVSNSCGSVTSNIAQLVIQNLNINTQPVGQTVCPGANVTFTVAASGPSVSYQWKKNNVDLLSENGPSLNLNNVSASDAASYTVLVSGCSNSILSNAAVLGLSVCTGIEDETNNHRFRIYPNPATTTVHVNGFAQDPIRSIMIVDVNGEVVYQEKELNASSHELSVNNFAQGLYHVVLFTASGNKWVEKVEIVK